MVVHVQPIRPKFPGVAGKIGKKGAGKAGRGAAAGKGPGSKTKNHPSQTTWASQALGALQLFIVALNHPTVFTQAVISNLTKDQMLEILKLAIKAFQNEKVLNMDRDVCVPLLASDRSTSSAEVLNIHIGTSY